MIGSISAQVYSATVTTSDMLTCIQPTYIWSVGFHHVVRVGVLGLIMISAHAVHRVAGMHVVLRLCTLLAGDVFVYIYTYMYV